MQTNKNPKKTISGGGTNRASSSVEELLLAALERGDDSLQTGRFLVTFKEGAGDEGLKSLTTTHGMRVADAREFDGQAATLESVGDADAFVLPEIGVALLSGDSARERSLGVLSELASDSPYQSIDPEYFQFSSDFPGMFPGSLTQPAETSSVEYLRGFLRAAEIIAKDLQASGNRSQVDAEEVIQVLGATWGLVACKVPPSVRSAIGIKIAVLDTGFDLGHPDFVGRTIVSQTFVGEPVQDLNGHGTHTAGTACGPKAPAGSIPRYGIGYRSSMYIGKVLNNTGAGSQAGVLAGMNWAIVNRCPVISVSLGAQLPPQPSYTAAGQAALNNGCLIIAASGGSGGVVGSPANSPTIMSVAALDRTLAPSPSSPRGKIEISGPAIDVFSSWPRPTRYNTLSGTSCATPHVAGCAALWAETSPSLRGMALWRKLQETARRLPYPPPIVGAGLVQAP